jgi:DNA-binding response OmpR family regulator
MAHILVIDDDIQVCSMLKTTLEKHGHVVDIAYDGEQGCSMFKQQHMDLVITDLVMPNKEGIETIVDLKKESANVKIIAISGGGRIGPDTYLETVKQLGAEMTFEKPVEYTDLLNAIDELLNF